MFVAEPVLLRVALVGAAVLAVVGADVVDAVLRVQQMPPPFRAARLLALVRRVALVAVLAVLRARQSALDAVAVEHAACVGSTGAPAARHAWVVAVVAVGAVVIRAMPLRLVVEYLDLLPAAAYSAYLVLDAVTITWMRVRRVGGRRHGLGTGVLGTGVNSFATTAVTCLLETILVAASMFIAVFGI